MKRYAILYLATLIVIIPIDFLFLGTIAKSFFTSQVGDMLGEIRLAPAILFYLLFVAGILIFVSGPADCDLAIDAAVRRAVRVVLLCDVRAHRAVAVEALDLAGGRSSMSCWGTFVTAVSSTIGLMLANLIAPKI